VLPTFVIGLREGLEAALIVGIIAAFLARQNRRDALRQVWVGVLTAVAICVSIAVALQLLERVLPQRQQEMLETVVGALAVVMVTAMIVWMRRHARAMKGELEGAAAAALAVGSARALVAMAFLAVLREGFETSVFLLATFQASGNAVTAGVGATLGILAAAALGWAIFHGGVRLNLARFFTLTSVLLVLVAAGLVMTAFHTAHEAGWVTFGQAQALDLTWLVRPGTPVAALLTGVLGIQPMPVVVEVVAWVLYAVPMLVFVLRPASSPPAKQPVSAPATPVLEGSSSE
jgi:high-affinity iron transporter